MTFTNARLIFPDGIRDGFEVIVEEGKIAGIHEAIQSREDQVIDLNGYYLAPGFIDLHVHGGLGCDTMDASAEAFRTICDFHASGGTTSLLLTTATAPFDKIVSVLRAVRDFGSDIPAIAGVHVEGPFISKAKPGAQRAEFIQDPSPDVVRQLLAHANVIKRVTLAPELPGALEAIKAFYSRGINVSGGHSEARGDAAQPAL